MTVEMSIVGSFCLLVSTTKSLKGEAIRKHGLFYGWILLTWLAYLPDKKQEYVIDDDALSHASELSVEGRDDITNLDELVKDYRRNRRHGMLGWFKLKGLSYSPEMQQKVTKTFSGAWRMRVALACALFISQYNGLAFL